MRLGKNMKHALEFATKYPGWHGYAYQERYTREAIERLAKLGLIEISAVGHCFRIKEKE